MSGRRFVVVLVTLFVVGCSKPPAPPVPPVEEPTPPIEAPAPAPEPSPLAPIPSPSAVPIAHLSQPMLPDVTVSEGTSEVALDEEPFQIRFEFPAGTTPEQVQAALKIAAPVAPRIQQTLLSFPAGKAGDVITVRLKGSLGGVETDLGFVVTRFPSPRVTAELQSADGGWLPITTVPVLAPGPVSLRFRLHGGADLDAVRLKVDQAIRPAQFQLTVTAPDLIVVTIPAPPPLLTIDFQGVKGDHGVIVYGGITLYVGEQPRLVLLDPATGAEEPVRDAPADIVRTSLSPDGRWLMITAMAPEALWSDQVWVLDLQTKLMRLTPFRDEAWRGTPVVWLSDRMVLPTSSGVQVWHLAEGKGETRPTRAGWWETASPDGRYLIGFDVDYGRENERWLAPATLYIHDVETGSERVLADLVQYRVPHKGVYAMIRTAWAADGRHILINDFRWKDAAMSAIDPHFVRVDVATGAAEASAAGSLPEVALWSEWLTGPGGWQLANNSWGAVVLRAPDGAEQKHGSGLMVGWTPQGKVLLVRWPVEQRRWRMGE